MTRSRLAGRLGPGDARRGLDAIGAVCAAGPLAVAGAHDDGAVICALDGHLTGLGPLARIAGCSEDEAPESIVGRAYARLGDSLLEQLHGEFALLLWDRRTSQGLLARDRLGSRTLFVHTGGTALSFASEVRDLLDLIAARPAPDAVAAVHWLAGTTPPDGHTLYAGVTKLPPGHLIRLSPRAHTRARWWAPLYRDPSSPASDDAAATLRAAMASAVERSLETARSPALLLSGGLDSAAVAASAAPGSLVAYSAVFPDEPAIDESSRIRAVRDARGIAGVEVAPPGGSALQTALRFLKTWQVPTAAPNLFVWEPLHARARADGVDVLLDGEGGDELFGCSPHLAADLLARGRPLAAARTVRAIPGMGADPTPALVRRAFARYALRGVLPRRLHELLRRARRRDAPTWLRPDAARVHRETHDPWRWKRLDGPRWWAVLADALTLQPDAAGVPDQLLREADVAGLALRHPLRDESLVESVLRLPPELAFDPTLDRPLARAAVRGELPDAVRLNPSKPSFNALLERALTGIDSATATALLGRRAAVRELVEPAALADLAEPPPGAAARAAWTLDLWRVLALECWLRLQAGEPEIDRLASAYDGSRHGVPG